MTRCSGLEVQKPTQTLLSLNGPSKTLDLISKLKRTLLSLIYFSWDIFRDPLHKKNSNMKVDIGHPAVGLRCRNPRVLISDKDPGNTFDINPKWTRTLPFLIYFSWDIYREPPPHFVFSNIRFDIWHPAVGLRCTTPPRDLCQLKAREIPLT